MREFGSLESEKALAEYAHQVGIPRCRINLVARPPRWDWSLVMNSGYFFEHGSGSSEAEAARAAGRAAMSHLMQEVARRHFLDALPECTGFPENTLLQIEPWLFLYRVEDNLGALVADPGGWWCSVRGLFPSSGLAPDLDTARELVRTLCSAQSIMRRWLRERL